MTLSLFFYPSKDLKYSLPTNIFLKGTLSGELWSRNKFIAKSWLLLTFLQQTNTDITSKLLLWIINFSTTCIGYYWHLASFVEIWRQLWTPLDQKRMFFCIFFQRNLFIISIWEILPVNVLIYFWHTLYLDNLKLDGQIVICEPHINND